MYIRGDHPTKKILKVSPIAAFNKTNHLSLVLGHLVVSGFGVILTQKLGCCVRSLEGPKCKKEPTLTTKTV